MAVWRAAGIRQSRTAATGLALSDDHPYRAQHKADPDRGRRAPQPRHGAAPEPWPVPNPGDPRSRGQRRRFHSVLGNPEYRLGAVAGTDRRDRRPFRIAPHDDVRGGDLCRRTRDHGGRRRGAGLVSGAFVGVALSCTASSLAMTAVARAVPEHRRSTTLGIVSAGGSLGTLMVPLVTQGLLANWAWQMGALFFVALAAAMLPAAFLAGGIDKVPHPGGASRVSMRGCAIANFW